MTMTCQKAKILVVDDHDAARYTVVRTLRTEGHDVIEAASGRAAIAVAREREPDLLVLDVLLPDILGYDVAEMLRSDPATRSIAILQISASYTSADAQAQGLRRGADAYLTQPLDSQVLLATVGALLRMRAAEQQARSERAHATESERRYRFLADMLPQLIWTADADGHPDYFNKRYQEFTAQAGEDGQMGGWLNSVHPDDRARFREEWQRALNTGTTLEIECRRWSQAARAFRWLLVRALPMKDAQGRVVRWFGTGTEIESQRQALAERDKLLGEAHAATAERDSLVQQLREEATRRNEFLAMLSHELRNPLAPIRNSLYILEHGRPEGEQARRAREVIDRQTNQMARLVDDLLDVTRIARGKVRLQCERLDLNALVRRSAEDHRSLLTKAGLGLDVHILEEPLQIHGDAARLTQVLGNLLHNSAKFTPAGGQVSVSLTREAPDHAVIRVRDTGAGISPEILDRLFEPFVQANRTLDRSRGGLGLGLALAHGIVELHRGSIAATSPGPGQGSEFVVRLPLETHATPRPTPGTVVESTARPCRVLIVEDLVDAAESLRAALALSGHEVEVAYDGPSGLARARGFVPDVVICDLGLPIMDGFALARELRQDPALASSFLIALSGYALAEDVEKSKAAGFDEHMAKPPRLEALEEALARAACPARGHHDAG